VVRAGSWLYCEVEHLPVTMIRVPGGNLVWSNPAGNPSQQSLGSFGPKRLRGLFVVNILSSSYGTLT